MLSRAFISSHLLSPCKSQLPVVPTDFLASFHAQGVHAPLPVAGTVAGRASVAAKALCYANAHPRDLLGRLRVVCVGNTLLLPFVQRQHLRENKRADPLLVLISFVSALQSPLCSPAMRKLSFRQLRSSALNVTTSGPCDLGDGAMGVRGLAMGAHCGASAAPCCAHPHLFCGNHYLLAVSLVLATGESWVQLAGRLFCC